MQICVEVPLSDNYHICIFVNTQHILMLWTLNEGFHARAKFKIGMKIQVTSHVNLTILAWVCANLNPEG